MINLNADLSSKVAVNYRDLNWSPSPSPSVFRKRLYKEGPDETCRVTSIVRYKPNSSFHEHGHPDGEEILVLEGTFSDQHGDWPEGSHLLNPQTFSHAPFSEGGCVIFVKLRQYGGENRLHRSVRLDELEWVEEGRKRIKVLYDQDGYDDMITLEKWEGPYIEEREFLNCTEFFIVNGELADESSVYRKWSWIRFPAGSSSVLSSNEGALVYVRSSGFE